MSVEEIWHVKLPNGDSRSGSLEQLDDAFQAGLIDEQTLVRREGTDRWISLAQAAGLEEMPETLLAPASVPAPAAVAAPAPIYSTAPVAIDPVTPEFELEFDPSTLRTSKRNVVLGVVGALALGIGAIVAAGSAMSHEVAASSAPPPVVADLHSVTTAPVEAQKPSLSEDQRKALLEADKAREAESQKKRAAAALKRGPGASTPIKQGNPFHKGGSKYDPLNGSL